MIKAWLLAILLGVVALAPIFGLAYYRSFKTESQFAASVNFSDDTSRSLEPGAELNVRACKVIDGYRFEICLEGGKRIIAHLTHATKEEATPTVVELLNSTAASAIPTVTLLRQVGNYWIVDLHVKTGHKTTNLVDYLKAKELLL